MNNLQCTINNWSVLSSIIILYVSITPSFRVGEGTTNTTQLL